MFYEKRSHSHTRLMKQLRQQKLFVFEDENYVQERDIKSA